MPRLAATSPGLPSLIMPCPVCTGRIVFGCVRQTVPASDLEDSVYACERCGTELIRTAYRKANKADAA